MRIVRSAAASMLLLAACGGGPSAPGVVAEISSNLRALRSGLLELRVEVRSDGDGPAPIAEVAALGSFQATEPGELPAGDLTVTDLSPARSFSRRIVTTAGAGFVRVDGAFYELPPDRLDPTGRARDAQGLFQGISMGEWIADPTLTEGEGLDGQAVNRIEGDLVVEDAFDDLLTIVERLPTGGSFPVLAELDPGELAGAVDEARIEVVSGSDDGQVRRISMALGLDPEASISTGPEWESAARITVDLGISEPNRKLRVAPPRRALPGARLDQKWP